MGRDEECRAIDVLLGTIREGASASLVLIGEPGIGKTRLLEYAADRAPGQMTRTVGVESEAQLGFAALHRLLLPFLDRIPQLPEPQGAALRSAFGLTGGPPPDRFLIGLATLTLLADVATDASLLCLIDDAHWLDRESLEALAFVGRRLHADAVGLLLCLRPAEGPPSGLDGLPTRHLAGLQATDAGQLLRSAAGGRVHDDVVGQLVAQTGGNPLALIALTEELTHEQLAGRSTLPTPLPAGQHLDQLFARKTRRMPRTTRSLLLLASLVPPDDAVVLWRAATQLGLSPDDADPALAEGIVRLDGGAIAFRHPLVRSAVHGDSPPAARRSAHAALAAATDPDHHPERRAWHLAAAAIGPDAGVADELVRSADRVRDRGGYSAEAAYLLRAAELTPDRDVRADRFLAAAWAHFAAGDTAVAQTVLDRSVALRDGVLHGSAQQLHASIEMTFVRVAAVPSILVAAAAQAAPLDVPLARAMLFKALAAAMISRQATTGTTLVAVARATLDTPRTTPDGTVADMLLDAMAARLALGHSEAVPLLRLAVASTVTDDDLATAEGTLVVQGCMAADELWDEPGRRALLHRFETLARGRGGLNVLAITLLAHATSELRAGHFTTAEEYHAEAVEITSIVGGPDGSAVHRMEMFAWQGREPEARAAAAEALDTWSGRLGLGVMVDIACHALTVLELGLGRYADALVHARRLFDGDAPGHANLGLPDLVEAGVRADDRTMAVAALARLTERATGSGTGWALGVLARSRALLADDEHCAGFYREAIEHLTPTSMAAELARTHLLHGEWLRRRKRRTEARDALRTAHAMFAEMGAAAFAERARAELAATGERVPKRTAQVSPDLTPQEAQVARLAAEGSTNAEIATRLYITSSTVEYHLNKVFRKLDLTSRRQLRTELRGGLGAPFL